MDEKEKYNTIDGACVPAAAFAERAVYTLCNTLDINRNKSNWREQLAPFAPVLVAMITASMRDYEIEWAERTRNE